LFVIFRILVVFGTRPEAIKMAPLISELRKHRKKWDVFICITSQHQHMLKQVLEVFQIKPDFDLNVMTNRQTLTEVTTRVLVGMEKVFDQLNPNLVLVHGDTTTTFSVSLAAAYRKICIGHIEAGMRTYKKYQPYPEELNRRLVGVLADLHFAPTQREANYLYQEGVAKETVYITGNTVIDALKTTVRKDYRNSLLDQIQEKKMILITAHRRENIGESMEKMFRAIRRLVEVHPNVAAVFPVHLNPVIREKATSLLGNHPRIYLIDPLNVIDFHNLAARSHFILTDSGGIQEEAPSLKVPVLVMRHVTERPEAVSAGVAKLVGTDETMIFEEGSRLILDDAAHRAMTGTDNPYGDGWASERIVQGILYYFGLSDHPPAPFRWEKD
jgi:UDP-N-acetylglucosamine 2-epimerase (non-hydrolysing)